MDAHDAPLDQNAAIVADKLGLESEYHGGDRGWTGDGSTVRLSIEKLNAIGCVPSMIATR